MTSSLQEVEVNSLSMMGQVAPSPYTSKDVDRAVELTSQIRDDGRVDITLDSKLGRTLSNLLVRNRKVEKLPPSYHAEASTGFIVLNIVIQVVGSRGDVQPFLALGQELQRHGHRVRLATHEAFENFVRESGLEFYPIGGDPVVLMAFMVKNPGLIPSLKTLKEGEIRKKRAMISEMLEGCWDSCIQPDPATKIPFVAEAIISNPVAFAHVHCAQALGIPLHLMFTMPWSSTTEFSHPLANIRNTTISKEIANWLSYGVVEWLTWQGLGDVINSWRKTLDLEAISATTGPLLSESLKIPFTYCWSPALVPKPADWPSNIDVCGFFFRELPQYVPPKELDDFLRAGPAPVYIGFGSIVIDDPEIMTDIILNAVEEAGVRAIVSRGWSKLGGDRASTLTVFYLDECPHEWLFQHVSAVFHHGGAGTTACGLLNGRPTTIVPFFGDQPFWGYVVSASGAGPAPIHHKSLTASNLTEAIRFCLRPETSQAANVLAKSMNTETGVQTAVASFHRNLPPTALSCEIFPRLPAVWQYAKAKQPILLSKLAAEILVEYAKIDYKDLQLYQASSVEIRDTRWDPVTAYTSSLLGTASDMGTNVIDIVKKPVEEHRKIQKELLKHPGVKQNGAMPGLRMVGAGAKSVLMFGVNLFKGTMVDLPVAVTEGLRATPRLYGEEVAEHGVVSDWKSGALVAGKSFTQGMYEGLTDIVTKPMKGSEEDGALGFAKGVGRGVVGLTTKTAGAILGLVAYPGQGIVKSIHTMTHLDTKRSITSALRTEGVYLRRTEKGQKFEGYTICNMFDDIKEARLNLSSRGTS